MDSWPSISFRINLKFRLPSSPHKPYITTTISIEFIRFRPSEKVILTIIPLTAESKEEEERKSYLRWLSVWTNVSRNFWWNSYWSRLSSRRSVRRQRNFSWGRVTSSISPPPSPWWVIYTDSFTTWSRSSGSGDSVQIPTTYSWIYVHTHTHAYIHTYTPRSFAAPFRWLRRSGTI